MILEVKIITILSLFISILDSINGREIGIRTPGGVTLNGFQDRRFRPLSHFPNYSVFSETHSAPSWTLSLSIQHFV